MNWIQAGAFKLVKNQTKHYVVRINNTGKREINVPKSVNTKWKAVAWLKANPTKVGRFKPKKKPMPIAYSAVEQFQIQSKPNKLVPYYNASPKYNNASPIGYFNPSKMLKASPKYPSPNYNLNKLFKTPEVKGVKRTNFYQNSTANGKTGAAITTLRPNGTLRTSYNLTKRRYVHKGVALVGGGAQAAVYLGFRDKELKEPLSIKVFPFDKTFPWSQQPSLTEFQIGKALHKINPRHIPKYISYERTTNFAPLKNFKSKYNPLYNFQHQSVIFSEYFHGGDLIGWLKKVDSRLTEAAFMDIIRQVLDTVASIHAKFPGFRHNDLHPGNVFVDDTELRPRMVIGDFGISKLSSDVMSYGVARGNFKSNGVSQMTDERYDAVLFLYIMRKYERRFPKFREFLRFALPAAYREKDGKYIKEGRLKLSPEYPGLPSTLQMLHALVKPPTSTTVVTAPSAKSTNASAIALAALKGVPGVKITAAEFLKLSPKSKAAMKGVAKKTEVLQFKKVAGNATKTKPTATLGLVKLLQNKSLNKLMVSPYGLNRLYKTPTPKSPYNLAKLSKTPSPKVPSPYGLSKLYKTPLKAFNILNAYTQGKNVGKLTVRNLRKVLGNGPTAKKNARAWANRWGRRQNLKLSVGSNMRVRMNKKLLEGLKKDVLVALAKKYSLPTSGTKATLIHALWSR